MLKNCLNLYTRKHERFTIMGWKETQEFINKLIKQYEWTWDVRLDGEVLI